MQTSHRSPFLTIHTEGALLPVGLLQCNRKNDCYLEGLDLLSNTHYRVEPQLLPDVLGIYVYLPQGRL